MQAKIASPRNGVSLCLLFLCAPFCFTTHAQGNAPGKALQFDGSTYVSIPDNGTLDLISNYTIEAWIKVSDTSNNTIIDKGNYRFLFQTHTSGNTGTSLYREGIGWIHSQGSVPTNTWTHVAVTVATDGLVSFYKNAQLLSSHASTLGSADNGLINIGRQSPDTCSCNLTNGQYDELRIWNSARSLQEIQADFNKSIDGNTSGILAYWKFNEETGTNVTDSSQNANHGTITGTADWGNSTAPVTAPASPPSTPPFELNSTAPLSVSENQPVGTVVGEFNASASSSSFTFEVSAHTSQASTAETNGGVAISFLVNGAWTSNESFFGTTNKGDVETKNFTTAAKPTKLKFTANSNDAWGCWKIVFAGTTVLLDPNGVSGSASGTAPYWVDGDNDQGMPTSQEHVLPSPAYVFSLVDGNGSTGNSLFTLESNGTLKTAAILDYEANTSHSIRVRATDELNASLEGNFTIALLNQVEDLDGDDVEDHYDTDDDGDGFPDATEIASGSDPRDPNSVPNSAPTALDLNSTAPLS
ncbi:MAG: hypothetical protein HN531_03900, partial [Opitutae bacterium]|nr:hypothetical protein [Opitutae bacterium]